MTLMPRVAAYSVLGASTVNTIATEVEGLGRACRVRRTSSLSLTSATRTVVTWNSEDYDTNGGGMWTPTQPDRITIPVTGTYVMLAQVRWDDVGGAGSAYRAGLRNAYITVDSTDPSTAACKGNVSMPASISAGEGTTTQTHAVERLNAGDVVYLVVSQDCGSTIVGCHQDFGGTYLSVTRIAGSD